MVGSRDCAKLLDGVRTQVYPVRSAREDAVLDRSPRHGVLYVAAEEGALIGGGGNIRGAMGLPFTTWRSTFGI